MVKHCAKCDTEKPAGCFGRDRHRANGLAIYCRDCSNAMGREWHAKNKGKYAAKQAEWARNNKDKGREKSAAWRSRNPEKARAAWRGPLLRKYGLTVEAYDAMYLLQGGKCAICSAHFGTLCVDHCHDSGRVRGLLCKPCNLVLGNAAESQERLANAIDYLRRNSDQSAAVNLSDDCSKSHETSRSVN